MSHDKALYKSTDALLFTCGRDAGADVARPLLGDRSPGHLSFAAHSAQHGRRRRLPLAGRVGRQRPASVAPRRRLLLLRQSAALGVHQRQHLPGRHEERRTRLLRLLLRVRLLLPAVRHQPPVRTPATSPPQPSAPSRDVRSARSTSTPVRTHPPRQHTRTHLCIGYNMVYS